MKKVLFIHVPKTAGQSVHKALGMNNRPHRALFRRSVGEGVFVFSIVRNPYDRAVSLYHWFEQLHLQPKKKRLPHNAAMNALARSCEDVNEFWCRFMRPEVVRYQVRYTPMLKTQLWYLAETRGGRVLDPRLGRVLRFESLADEWKELADEFGLRDLPRVNASKRKAWEDELNDEAREVVREIYGCDFDLFNYQR